MENQVLINDWEERQKEVILQQALKITQLETLLETKSENLKVSFAKFLEDWLKKQTHLSPNTYRTYKSELENHFIPYFSSDIMLHNVTAAQIEEFYRYKLRSGYNPNFVIRLHSYLHSAFKDAARYEFIDKNPMDTVQRPKEAVFIANWYDSEQIAELLKKVKNHKLFLPIVIAALLGLRRSEIVALKWEHINLSHATISIREKTICLDKKDINMKKLKTLSSYRTLVLPNTLVSLFKTIKKRQEELKKTCPSEHRDNFEFVCLDMHDDVGKRLTLRQISDGFRRLINQVAMPRIRFHDLRHSCATYLLHNGCTMLQVQQWLGHSNYSTTANYYD